MKNFISLILLFLVVFFSGCKKASTNTDQYYVKYEVKSSTIYSGRKLQVLLRSDNNQIVVDTINTQTPWETTIGPVNRGFNANIQVNEIGTNYGRLTLQSQISINKNSSAFALKSSDNSTSPRTSVQLEYTINY
jgi:carbon monoxide dehydrogenase subunit G